jgi:hypothetical protein
MKHPSSSEMEGSVVLAAGAALVLILVFAVYVRFFPTPVSFLFGYEPFVAATMYRPATGTSRQQRLTK